jgi:hypothetical protein
MSERIHISLTSFMLSIASTQIHSSFSLSCAKVCARNNMPPSKLELLIKIATSQQQQQQ